jgi:hypothetical protein
LPQATSSTRTVLEQRHDLLEAIRELRFFQRIGDGMGGVVLRALVLAVDDVLAERGGPRFLKRSVVLAGRMSDVAGTCSVMMSFARQPLRSGVIVLVEQLFAGCRLVRLVPLGEPRLHLRFPLGRDGA